MSIIVRKAELTDDEGIFDVEREAFSLPWSLASIQRELADPERTIYYVLMKDKLRILPCAVSSAAKGTGNCSCAS